MVSVSRVVFLGSLFALTLGNPLGRPAMVVHETQKLPRGFSQQGPASADTVLNMRIALTQADRDGLIEALMDVSTPSSASYGKHLTKEQVCFSLESIFFREVLR